MSIINLSSLIGIQDYTYLPVSSKIAVLFLRFLLIKYPFEYIVSWLYQIKHETKKSEDWEFKFHMNLCGRDCSGEWSQRPRLESWRKRKHLFQVKEMTQSSVSSLALIMPSLAFTGLCHTSFLYILILSFPIFYSVSKIYDINCYCTFDFSCNVHHSDMSLTLKSKCPVLWYLTMS